MNYMWKYHDLEWWVCVHDDNKLFEFLDFRMSSSMTILGDYFKKKRKL